MAEQVAYLLFYPILICYVCRRHTRVNYWWRCVCAGSFKTSSYIRNDFRIFFTDRSFTSFTIWFKRELCVDTHIFAIYNKRAVRCIDIYWDIWERESWRYQQERHFSKPITFVQVINRLAFMYKSIYWTSWQKKVGPKQRKEKKEYNIRHLK